MIKKHSDEIHEIITKVPSWIVRWGITLFGCILLLIFSVSAIIQYPDMLRLPVQFHVTPKGDNNYGLIQVRQENFTKIKLKQKVLIELSVYPVEEYGLLEGEIMTIPDEPNTNGLFPVKIKLNVAAMRHPIKLKCWMVGRAAVVTQDVSLFKRIARNLMIK